MRPAPRKILLVTACLLIVSSWGWANVINFSNLPGNGSAVPEGYAGFNWHNFYDMSGNSALTAALPSLSFAFNHAGTAAFSQGGSTFSFDNAWFESMGTRATALEVEGELHGKIIESKLIVVTSTPELQTFDWSGVTEVRFTPLALATNTAAGAQFLITNLTVNAPGVPEPTTLLLLGSSLGLVFTRLRKRQDRE